MAEKDKDIRIGKAVAALAGGAALGVGAAIALAKPAEAEELPPELVPEEVPTPAPPPPANVTEALARLDATLRALNLTLLDVNIAVGALTGQQDEVLTELGALSSAITGLYPEAAETRFLETFSKVNKTLLSKVPLTLSQKEGRGGLIWALVDVSDPDTEISIKVDQMVWRFTLSTLLTQGVEHPSFPGAWLTKATAGPPAHYCLVFSAGTPSGLTHAREFHIYVTHQGTGVATLYEGRGIRWEPS